MKENLRMSFRILLFVAVFSFFHASLLGQPSDFKAVQTLSPKEIFVGDTAEISYTFYSPIAFPMGESDFIPLTFPEAFQSREFSVTGGCLSRTGNQYRLSISFIPWKVGLIVFPHFDLLTLLNPSFAGYIIDLNPVEVASIVEKTGKKTVRPSLPPVLLPGTTYMLYAAAVACLIFFMLVLKLLFNLNGVLNFFSGMMVASGYARNARRLLRKLKKLNRAGKKITDADFAGEVENAVRNYLCVRFDPLFLSTPANGIYSLFQEITGETMSDEQCSCAEKIASLFVRMDYIRYARNSADSFRMPESQYKAEFSEGERAEIVNSLKEIVKSFEKPAKACKKSDFDRKSGICGKSGGEEKHA